MRIQGAPRSATRPRSTTHHCTSPHRVSVVNKTLKCKALPGQVTSLIKSIFMLVRGACAPNALLRVLHPNILMLNGCQEQLAFPTCGVATLKAREALVCGITNIAYSGQLVHFVCRKRRFSRRVADMRFHGFKSRSTGRELFCREEGLARSSNTLSSCGVVPSQHQRGEQAHHAAELLARAVRELAGEVETDAPLMEAGVDSLAAAELAARLSGLLQR